MAGCFSADRVYINMGFYQCRTVFQGVHNMWQFGDSKQPQGTKKLNQMVFIGRELNRAELESAFTACLMPPEA